MGIYWEGCHLNGVGVPARCARVWHPRKNGTMSILCETGPELNDPPVLHHRSLRSVSFTVLWYSLETLFVARNVLQQPWQTVLRTMQTIMFLTGVQQIRSCTEYKRGEATSTAGTRTLHSPQTVDSMMCALHDMALFQIKASYKVITFACFLSFFNWAVGAEEIGRYQLSVSLMQ